MSIFLINRASFNSTLSLQSFSTPLSSHLSASIHVSKARVHGDPVGVGHLAPSTSYGSARINSPPGGCLPESKECEGEIVVDFGGIDNEPVLMFLSHFLRREF